MLKKLNKSNKGFTIIEVLIVLAIAALILLIVFLAVPALQRNSRNTQRKNDVAAVGGAISNFITNNGGALPTSVGYDAVASGDSTVFIFYCNGATPSTTDATTNIATSAVSTGCANTITNYETAKQGLYKPSDLKIYYANAGTGFSVVAPGTESATAVSTSSIIVDLQYTCNPSGSGIQNTKNTRAFAILYATETAGGNGNMQCIQS